MFTLTRITFLVHPDMTQASKDLRRKDRWITGLFILATFLVLMTIWQRLRCIELEYERNVLLLDQKTAALNLEYEKKKYRNLEQAYNQMLTLQALETLNKRYPPPTGL